MSEKQGISVKAAVLYGMAIIVVAFIGVLLGNWFVEWKQARNAPRMPELGEWMEHNSTLLHAGEKFPGEELLDMDSNRVFVDSVITGRKTLILIMSPGCGPCATAVNFWNKSLSGFPPDLSIIGLIGGDLADARAYRDARKISFPVYCDPLMLYTQQYEIVAFPTLIGLNDIGQVTFVWHGFSDRYNLNDYYNAINGFTADVTDN